MEDAGGRERQDCLSGTWPGDGEWEWGAAGWRTGMLAQKLGGKAHISVLRFTAFSKIPKQAIPVLTKTRWSWGSTGVLWTRAQSSGGL